MAVAAMRGFSDADLAFQMQINEALAASMGIDTLDRHAGGKTAGHSSGPRCMEMDDGVLATRIQEMEIEMLQRQEEDRGMATKLVKSLAGAADQLLHDESVAREIDEMSDSEWEENGDLYERPFVPDSGASAVKFFRVFFKGYPVTEGVGVVGVAIGGSIMDSEGNELLQVKNYIGIPMGKNVAQYVALVEVLKSARSLGARKIIAYTDSRPVHNQLKGYWKATTRTVKAEYEKAVELIDRLESFDINLGLHGENWPAENLAKSVAINRRQSAAGSSGSMFHCEICLDDIREADVYTLAECDHKFCLSCVRKHLEATITTGRTFPVSCPDVKCEKKFTEDECKLLLSDATLKLFMKKIEEERIPEADRVYCPYPNCSKLMDRVTFPQRGVRRLCVACKRDLCLECRVPWHENTSCTAYQKLPPELKDAADAKLYKLAKNENWRQCKQCRRMIELSEGCYHMTCRCGFEFCYVCGKEYRNKIQMCSCKLWDEHYIIDDGEDDDDDDYDDDDDSFEEDGSSDYESDHDRFYKTKECIFFAQGGCHYGVNCRFAHGADELR